MLPTSADADVGLAVLSSGLHGVTFQQTELFDRCKLPTHVAVGRFWQPWAINSHQLPSSSNSPSKVIIYSLYWHAVLQSLTGVHHSAPQFSPFRRFYLILCCRTSRSVVQLNLIPYFGNLFTPFKGMCSWHNLFSVHLIQHSKISVRFSPSFDKNFMLNLCYEY
jgi:hypothetical protein